eukprot:CAMPEP_0114614610 /NCGR_PEP_ID=MMETSP0168-20121206/5743_1 /TAXON_ID=95228 ORGANISM="Vannella sp., Strain DIVA3 517/6/12" /NCGR_SAMPLE_ID=MMETSP0168 /ASSEMBLY_ACC=CAM_ASM_000044 /LENGTH=296 /DNA_ID=CAMNT_0001825665 /DNA_START=1 /DNA_END=891 /DNA_ORIENTATION=+
MTSYSIEGKEQQELLERFVQAWQPGDAEVWRLFYWPNMVGRGEFVRLVLAECDTAYEEVFAGTDLQTVASFNFARNKPFFAMPAIQHNAVFLSQSAVLVKYIAQHAGGGRLLPAAETDRYHAEMLMQCVVDWVAEGHDAWHPIDKNASHNSQAARAEPFMQYYKERRLPRWFEFFESALRRASQPALEKVEAVMSGRAEDGSDTASPEEAWLAALDEAGVSLYFVAGAISYLDLCMYHVCDGNRHQCSDEWQGLVEASKPVSYLSLFMRSIARRPLVAAHLASERRYQFTMTGPTF